MKKDGISRRYFFFGGVLTGAVPLGGFGSVPSLKALGYKSPNEKLNIASIGAGGKARSDIANCAKTENIVALCDVDDRSAAATYEKYSDVPKFKDYRIMLDKQISAIPVVEDGRIVGIISEGDLLQRAETGTERRLRKRRCVHARRPDWRAGGRRREERAGPAHPGAETRGAKRACRTARPPR